jgi:hypothetical protein
MATTRPEPVPDRQNASRMSQLIREGHSVGDLPISGNWVFFIGGIVGVISVLRAKKFSWSNSEFLKTEEERDEDVPMTMRRRLILLAVCALICTYGANQLQRERACSQTLSSSR